MTLTSDITIDELARVTRRHPETLRRLAREGKLPGVYRVGRRWMMSPEALCKLRNMPEEHCIVADGGVHVC